MEMLQEIEVWYIIPTIRKEIAIAMKKNGLKQFEIAKKLGITNPAVNQYLNKKRGNEIEFDKKILQEIKKSAIKINDKLDSAREIQKILRLLKKEKVTCKLHKSLNKEYCDCNLCFEGDKK